MHIICKHCGSNSLYIANRGVHTGLYCKDCGKWIKWMSKSEIKEFHYNTIFETTLDPSSEETEQNVIPYDISLGKLCCFKPLNSDAIYFGHMAGMVVEDFGSMNFMYVLKCDDRYFFSKECIVKPTDVHTSKDASKYFETREYMEEDLPWGD